MLSLTTGVKDRLDHLQQALNTWVRLPRRDLDEIIIVDWGSAPSVASSLKFDDDRIKILEVQGQMFWENARCHNLEFQAAKGDTVLRVDVDTLLSENFLNSHPLHGGMFYAGNFRTVPKERPNLKHLTGTLLIRKSDFFRVNGYNERLIHYGLEDDDLFHRLEVSGLQRRDLDLSTIDHIPHDDIDRWKNLRIASELPKKCERGAFSPRNGIRRERDLLLAISSDIVSRRPWTLEDKMTLWSFYPGPEPNLVLCEEVK